MGNLKLIIGRSSQCDYTIENAEQHGTVSGKHATISETDIPNTYLFEDHSTNGSYINGQLLHNDSCKVKSSDHITLGRTYTLPLRDIIKRYFTERRTTKKKQQKERTQSEPCSTSMQPQVRISEKKETRPMSSSEEAIVVNSDATMQAHTVVTRTNTKEKVPNWFWILYSISILISFVAGFFTCHALS